MPQVFSMYRAEHDGIIKNLKNGRAWYRKRDIRGFSVTEDGTLLGRKGKKFLLVDDDESFTEADWHLVRYMHKFPKYAKKTPDENFIEKVARPVLNMKYESAPKEYIERLRRHLPRLQNRSLNPELWVEIDALVEYAEEDRVEIANLTERVDNAEDDIKENAAKIEEQDAAIAKMDKRIDERDKSIEEDRVEIANLTERVDNAEDDIKENTAKVADLEEELAVLKTQMASFMTEKENNDNAKVGTKPFGDKTNSG